MQRPPNIRRYDCPSGGEQIPARIPSRELTYPPDKAYLKMVFLFPRWDMLVP